jgi:hypothetical protein
VTIAAQYQLSRFEKTMANTVVFRSIALVALCSFAACDRVTDPRGHIRAEAVVTMGAEGCPVALAIGGQHYVPVGLTASLAVPGLHLKIEGTVRDTPTVCMIGPVVDITSAVAAP